MLRNRSDDGEIRSESVGFSAALDLADGRLIMVCAPKDKCRMNLHLGERGFRVASWSRLCNVLS